MMTTSTRDEVTNQTAVMKGTTVGLQQLAVVIPSLNAAATVSRCIRALGDVGEIIVADGGSTDDTARIARRLGARVISTARGRGAALCQGALHARHPWLLFLHADTVLSSNWRTCAERFIERVRTDHHAGYFRFELDDTSRQARRVQRRVALRCRLLALPFGDQGLLISRTFYDELGGFESIPIMEDVDIVRRIGRHRLSLLDANAVTSSERWRRQGWTRRSARNLVCLSLYFAGVAPGTISKVYNAK
jgi:rSAM/selenodomain-associated transferase 2